MIERVERLDQILHDAILLAETSRENTVSHHLRSARLSLREISASAHAVRVDLMSGRVFSNGLPVALTRTELLLVFALAVHGRAGAPREVLAEDLYPDSPTENRLNAIKVTVHRVRRRLGFPGVVNYERRRFSLGERVDVELARIEHDVRTALLSNVLDGGRRDQYERLRQRLLDGRPVFLLECAWFDETESRIRVLAQMVSLALARDALRCGQYQDALDYANDLMNADPIDESAADIAIRAFLLAGDRTAAVLEFHRYASVLRREIGSPPSAGLRALVENTARS